MKKQLSSKNEELMGKNIPNDKIKEIAGILIASKKSQETENKPVIGFKTLKDIVDNTINLEFYHVETDSYDEVKRMDDYEGTLDRCIEIYKILCDNLPEDLQPLVDEYESKQLDLLSSHTKFFFKQGVISGLTNLKYLEEIGNAIVIL